jgi:hypothetical protein
MTRMDWNDANGLGGREWTGRTRMDWKDANGLGQKKGRGASKINDKKMRDE